MSGSASCSSSGWARAPQKADIRCGPCLSPFLTAAFDAKPQLASSSDTSVLTCDDARTLKFTLIVQGMPKRGRWDSTCLCADRHDYSRSANPAGRIPSAGPNPEAACRVCICQADGSRPGECAPNSRICARRCSLVVQLQRHVAADQTFGIRPTPIAAVTRRQRRAELAKPGPPGARGVAAMLVAAGASPAITTLITMTFAVSHGDLVPPGRTRRAPQSAASPFPLSLTLHLRGR